MGILVWFVAFRLLPANGGGPEQGLRIVAGVASGGLSYVLLARWVKSPELAVVAAVIRKKTGTD
jgi:hypothetical protein